jgi:hypothetical protein
VSQTFEHLTAESILAAAGRLGIRLEVGTGTWYDHERRCGCAAGVASLVLLGVAQAPRRDLFVRELVRDLNSVIVLGLNYGFEGLEFDPPEFDDGTYRHHFAIGRAVAAAVAGGGEAQHGQPV